MQPAQMFSCSGGFRRANSPRDFAAIVEYGDANRRRLIFREPYPRRGPVLEATAPLLFGTLLAVLVCLTRLRCLEL